MLKYCFNILILMRSSRKEFDNISVKSTLREGTPNSVCFLFFHSFKALSLLHISDITRFIFRVRTFFEKHQFLTNNLKRFELLKKRKYYIKIHKNSNAKFFGSTTHKFFNFLAKKFNKIKRTFLFF